jgi:hypothetical protein
MKARHLRKLWRPIYLALVVLLTAGCAGEANKTAALSMHCPPKYSFHYADATRGFALCLPDGVKKADASAYPAGSVLFSGFAVAKETNLKNKTLIIVPGNYQTIKDAAPLPDLTTNGVTFKRVKAEEGGAGHLVVHIIYTPEEGMKKVHFDFALRSVNVENFDSSDRPKKYSQAAQMRFTEEIMSTFKRLQSAN